MVKVWAVLVTIAIVGAVVPGMTANGGDRAETSAGCFCLHHPDDDVFLIDCNDITPSTAYQQRARCRHSRSGRYLRNEIVITDPWQPVPEGTGNCEPCEYIPPASGTPEPIRGDDDGESAR